MPKLYTLDAMRAVAALMVGALHFGMLTAATASPYLAVDFFFALSGFVIAYSYDRRLAEGMGVREFITRRLIRLYPLFVLGLSFGLLVAIAWMPETREGQPPGVALLQYFTGLLFLPFPPIFGNGAVSPLNGPYWSLILEVHINLVFVLVFRWLTMPVLAAIVLLSGAAVVATALMETTLETGYRLEDYHFGVARIFFSFFAGVLACRIRHRLRVPRLHWSILLLALALLLTLPTPLPIRWAYDSLCVLVLFPCLILCGAAAQPVSSQVRTVFILGGSASYAFYAIHRPFTPILTYVADAVPDVPFRVWSLLFLVLVAVLAVAADRLFDLPIRQWLSAWRGQRQRLRSAS